jgi:hypothetical protein
LILIRTSKGTTAPSVRVPGVPEQSTATKSTSTTRLLLLLLLLLLLPKTSRSGITEQTSSPSSEEVRLLLLIRRRIRRETRHVLCGVYYLSRAGLLFKKINDLSRSLSLSLSASFSVLLSTKGRLFSPFTSVYYACAGVFCAL